MEQENCPVCGQFLATFVDAETGEMIQACRKCLVTIFPKAWTQQAEPEVDPDVKKADETAEGVAGPVDPPA